SGMTRADTGSVIFAMGLSRSVRAPVTIRNSSNEDTAARLRLMVIGARCREVPIGPRQRTSRRSVRAAREGASWRPRDRPQRAAGTGRGLEVMRLGQERVGATGPGVLMAQEGVAATGQRPPRRIGGQVSCQGRKANSDEGASGRSADA